MAQQRFRLRRLEASAWRGIRETIEIPLDQPLNVIYGPNGSGKSSLLTAIEWALYPREAERLSDHRIGERREWEIRHLHGKARPDVRLWLAQGRREVEVHRTPRDRAPSPVTARYSDFKGLAFLHQETLRDFLVGTAGARQSAFQRLLGAGWAQDLAKAFDGTIRDLDADDADARVARLEMQLHTRLLEARRQLGQLEMDAAAAGLASPWEEAESRLTAEVEALKLSATAAAPTEAARQRLLLDARRAGWIAARELRDRAAEAAKQAASPEEIDDRLRRLAAERDGARTALRALDRHASLLREALAHVRDHPGAEACPVCLRAAGQGALFASLETRLRSTLGAEETALRAQLDAAQAAIGAADAQRSEAVRLRDADARAKAGLDRARAELEAALGRAIAPAQDPDALVSREISRLEAEQERERQIMQAAQARLAALERASAKAALARRAAEQARRVAKLGSLRDAPEWKAMLESQRKLAMRELMLLHGAAAVKSHATALAASNLDRAKKPITYIYSRLTQRKDFPAVAVRPDDKFEVALESAVAGTVAATSVLNLTDLNCLALAVTAGMAVAFPEAHDLEFLVLDDPSQSMDSHVAARLAPILGHLAKKLQIVIATPDAALVEALRAEPVYKNIVTLEPRDPRDATPAVRLKSVER